MQKITDYQVRGGFRLHARGTMAYSWVQRVVSLWIAMDFLAYILSHVMCVGPTSPGFGPKECDESSMHTHLLSAIFQVTFVSPYFLVGNGVGVVVQITWLYNLGVQRLKNEEDWSCAQLAFTCDLWKSRQTRSILPAWCTGCGTK